MSSLLTSVVIELSKTENRRWRECCRDDSLLEDVLLEVQRLWPPFFGGRRICTQVHYPLHFLLSLCLSVGTLTKALGALSWSESVSCATLIALFLLGLCLGLVIFSMAVGWRGLGTSLLMLCSCSGLNGLVPRLHHQMSWGRNQWWLGWGPMFYQNAHNLAKNDKNLLLWSFFLPSHVRWGATILPWVTLWHTSPGLRTETRRCSQTPTASSQRDGKMSEHGIGW